MGWGGGEGEGEMGGGVGRGEGEMGVRGGERSIYQLAWFWRGVQGVGSL
jgi:hypothetical protein